MDNRPLDAAWTLSDVCGLHEVSQAPASSHLMHRLATTPSWQACGLAERSGHIEV